MKSKVTAATIKSLGRGILGVLVGVVLVLSKEARFAPYAAAIPFILHFVDPTETEFGIGKQIVDDLPKDAKGNVTV